MTCLSKIIYRLRAFSLFDRVFSDLGKRKRKLLIFSVHHLSPNNNICREIYGGNKNIHGNTCPTPDRRTP
jgi:hypothetical protein